MPGIFTLFSRLILGSIISTAKVTKKEANQSPLVPNRSVALVSPLSIMLLPGLFKSKTSESKPIAFILLIFLDRIFIPSLVIVELKKLSFGFAAFWISVNVELLFEIIPKVSPSKKDSPSRALTPTLAKTGPTGMVLKPETVISAVVFPNCVVMPS